MTTGVPSMVKPRLGISSCLLGEPVRYDGGHKRDPFLVDTLGAFVEWVPVCPEAECGLGVPRETMRLVGSPDAPRLVTRKTGVDHTERMQKWAEGRLAGLEREDLDGFVLKSRSPSSGMSHVKVYDEHGVPAKTGVGIWARAFMQRFPLLPVEDDGRLHDPSIRENFIERVFCLRRYRDFRRNDASRAGLVAFHTDHKLLFLAHSPEHLEELGRIVADPDRYEDAELLAAYERVMTDCLRTRATPARHVNVLQHMMGYFKNVLSTDEKVEVLDVLESFRQELVPLVVPMTLMAHFVRKYDEPYLRRQVYLHPHPTELKLRNHA
ncbi:MAG TPA: DUF523 and DUF1722 domain-containing protein [Planctomycetota bacterium]|nr:DUF523 and DUF1722 domain-containing protein [Planctomycetota bacterium]